MVVTGNDVTIDMVWTDPAHRRQGLATAVMSALATHAQELGATTGLLAASADGKQLYESLRWTTFAEILVARTKP
jgi:predicted GNAT family acetyltransferase